jgi:hypothetical protein
MRLAPLTALLACAVALGPEAVLADHRFEFELGGRYVEGQGAQASSVFSRRVRDVDDGKQGFVALKWIPGDNWALRLEYTQAFFRYEDPSNVFCPVSAGRLTGTSFCQLSVFPRSGSLRDDFHSTSISVERSWRFSERSAIELDLGYEFARWNARDDHEIQTFSTCLLDSRPTPIRQCVPLRLRARSDGLIAGIAYKHAFDHGIGAKLGFHWQATSYAIHRNEAAPRFCASLPGLQGQTCTNELPGFLPSDISTNHDWTWWFGEVSWRVNESWELALTGESGGSRDWDSLGTSIRYRW